MIDTNMLISIAVFGSSKLGDLLNYIVSYHTLILSSYILEEFEDVIKRKFPYKIASVSRFFMRLRFELEYTPQKLPEHDYFSIRDKDDEPILYSAITADVDVLITGDKDFYDVEIERPEILSPAEFLAKYGVS